MLSGNPYSRPRPSGLHGAVLVALVAACMLPGCSEGGASSSPAGPAGRAAPMALRLVDLIEADGTQSALDLDDLAATLRLLPGRVQPLDAARAGEFRGERIAALCLEDDQAGLACLRTLPFQVPRDAIAAISLRGAAGAVAAFLVDAGFDAARLAAQEDIERMLSTTRAAWLPLEPDGRGGFFGVVPAGAERPLLACLVGRGAVPPPAIAELLLPERLGQVLLKSEPLPAASCARRLGLGFRLEECLVLAAPGRVGLTTSVPEHAPRLVTLVRGALLDSGRSRLDVCVDGQAIWSGDLDERPLPLSVDLAPHAGREVRLELRLVPAEAGQMPVVAFESPVLEGEVPDAPPDVIIISLDTARADRMSLYGGPRETTPSLDRLAGSSFVFDNAITAAPWTLPSHVSIFSGQLPDRHGVYREVSRVPAGLPWLPEDFRRAGYQTVAFTASGFLHTSFGFQAGFESYGTTEVAYPRAWAERKPELNGTNTLALARRAREERQRLLDLLGQERRRPLFLFVHTYQAHEYRGEPDVLQRFGADPADLDGLLTGPFGLPQRVNPFLARDMSQQDRERLRERAELMYDASLWSADELVGEIAAALEASGRLEHTLLVVLSDHGEALLERDDIGHGRALFEEQVRVPLLVRVPGLPPGRSSEVVSLVDLAPTLRELCGLPTGTSAAPLDGQSLVSLLAGRAGAPRLVLARGGQRSVDDPPFRALRGANLKLIASEGRDGRVLHQLFDLGADPLEQGDVAGRRDTDLRQARALLEQWVEALRSGAAGAADTTLDDETRRMLDALGYLGAR